MSPRMKVGIAGGGLLGRLLAWRLSCGGAQVTVFDAVPDAFARGAAGWTAAGMLSPWAELDGGDAAIARLGQRSIEAWPALLAGLPSPVDFRREGSLLLAHAGDGGAAARVLARIEARLPAGIAVQRLTARELHELEPELHGPQQAWLLPGEAQIHTVQAMRALAQGAVARGAIWLAGRTVRQVAPFRIGENRFDQVFDVRGRGADMPGLRGVRGEIAWLHAPGLTLHRPLRLLHPRHRVYLVPRRDDVIVVGASEIESEDRSPISVRTLLDLLGAADSVLPGLAEARLVHTEVNLRPALPDNLPRIERTAGLTRINGLYRHGWLLAPALVEDALASVEAEAA